MTWPATPRFWESTNALAIIADWKARLESALSEEDHRGPARTDGDAGPLETRRLWSDLEIAVVRCSALFVEILTPPLAKSG